MRSALVVLAIGVALLVVAVASGLAWSSRHAPEWVRLSIEASLAESLDAEAAVFVVDHHLADTLLAQPADERLGLFVALLLAERQPVLVDGADEGGASPLAVTVAARQVGRQALELAAAVAVEPAAQEVDDAQLLQAEGGDHQQSETGRDELPPREVAPPGAGVAAPAARTRR